MLTILSFDCGYRPLASCVIIINTQYRKDFEFILQKLNEYKNTILKEHDLLIKYNGLIDIINKIRRQLTDIVDNHVKLQYIKCEDLIPSNQKIKDVNNTFKAVYIKRYLISLDAKLKEMNISPDIILCEEQKIPSKGVQSIEASILYHYADINQDYLNKFNELRLQVINPRIKNRICLSNKNALKHATHIEKYKTRYSANKSHCKANFMYWIELFEEEEKIRPFKKKFIGDISDAFCQAIMWYFTCSGHWS